MATEKRWQNDAALIHELRNVFGAVQVAADELADPCARSDPDKLEELVRELANTTSRITAVLRLLTSDGEKTRPYDLRAAVWCAHLRLPALCTSEVGPPVIVDGRAGDGIALVLALVTALGAPNQVIASQDGGIGIVLSSRGCGVDTAVAAARGHSANARACGLLLAPEGEAVRLMPRQPRRDGARGSARL